MLITNDDFKLRLRKGLRQEKRSFFPKVCIRSIISVCFIQQSSLSSNLTSFLTKVLCGLYFGSEMPIGSLCVVLNCVLICISSKYVPRKYEYRLACVFKKDVKFGC